MVGFLGQKKKNPSKQNVRTYLDQQAFGIKRCSTSVVVSFHSIFSHFVLDLFDSKIKTNGCPIGKNTAPHQTNIHKARYFIHLPSILVLQSSQVNRATSATEPTQFPAVQPPKQLTSQTSCFGNWAEGQNSMKPCTGVNWLQGPDLQPRKSPARSRNGKASGPVTKDQMG